MTPADRDAVARLWGAVSRETTHRLDRFAAELLRWNRAINLVSRADLPRLWDRHINDSAQLWPLGAAASGDWLDIGSGAGFPGIIVAIFAAEMQPGRKIHLVESDQKKAAFLSWVVRELELPAQVHAKRVEILPPFGAGVVSARALAPLADLVAHAARHRRKDGIALFPKGGSYQKELDHARQRWKFDYRLHPSASAAEAAIVEIGAIHGAN